MTTDYTKDTVQLNYGVSQNKAALKILSQAKKNINNGQISTPDDYEQLFRYGLLGSIRTLNTYNTNTFNVLTSSGNIDLLGKTLTEQLMELNRLQNAENYTSDFNRRFLLEVAQSASSKYPREDGSIDKKILDGLWQNINKDNLPKDVISLIQQSEYTINRYIELSEVVLTQTELVLSQLHQ